MSHVKKSTTLTLEQLGDRVVPAVGIETAAFEAEVVSVGFGETGYPSPEGPDDFGPGNPVVREYVTRLGVDPEPFGPDPQPWKEVAEIELLGRGSVGLPAPDDDDEPNPIIGPYVHDGWFGNDLRDVFVGPEQVEVIAQTR